MIVIVTYTSESIRCHIYLTFCGIETSIGRGMKEILYIKHRYPDRSTLDSMGNGMDGCREFALNIIWIAWANLPPCSSLGGRKSHGTTMGGGWPPLVSNLLWWITENSLESGTDLLTPLCIVSPHRFISLIISSKMYVSLFLA